MTKNARKKNNQSKEKEVNDKRMSPRRTASNRLTGERRLAHAEARIKELSTALSSARDAMQALTDEDFSGSIMNPSDRVAYARLMERVEVTLREVEKVIGE